MPQRLEQRDRAHPQLDRQRHHQGGLGVQQEETHTGDRRAGDDDARVAGEGGEAGGRRDARERQRDPEPDEVPEQRRTFRGGQDRELAAPDRGQTRVGDGRDDAEQGDDDPVAAEVLDAQVPQQQHRGARPEQDPGGVPGGAQGAAADHLASRLGRPENVGLSVDGHVRQP